MISRYNFPRESHLGRCGCFLSHTKLLEHIVDNKLDDVLILEDDAIKINEIPLDYPKDSIVYLGGFIHHKKMMNNQKIEINHKKGINEVSEDYRMLGCLAYIIPHHSIALKILNKIYSSKRFKAIDIMMGNIGIKQYYNYPPSFIEEKTESQIQKKTKYMNDNYEWK
jgi:GR25 family glycosyltransferase involved in LPS biosynthesis